MMKDVHSPPGLFIFSENHTIEGILEHQGLPFFLIKFGKEI